MGRHRQCIERNSGKIPSCPGFIVGSHCLIADIKHSFLIRFLSFVLTKKECFPLTALIHKLLILHDEIYKAQFYILVSRMQSFFIK